MGAGVVVLLGEVPPSLQTIAPEEAVGNVTIRHKVG